MRKVKKRDLSVDICVWVIIGEAFLLGGLLLSIMFKNL